MSNSVTPWTIAHQAFLCMEFSSKGSWFLVSKSLIVPVLGPTVTLMSHSHIPSFLKITFPPHYCV